MSAELAIVEAPQLVKLDLGSGPNPKEGFEGCDRIAFEKVKHTFELGQRGWPFADSSVDEANCSHTLEHLTNFQNRWERVNFFNELYRVLRPGAKCAIVLPHWASNRYYGDPTHCEPFSEMGFYYLNREWRMQNAPHTDIKHNPNGYDCDLDCTWSYGMHPTLLVRNQEYQQFATQWLKEAVFDIHATATARKAK